MGGHMISVENGPNRHLYMANIADEEEARQEVIRRSGIKDAQALAPLADATLEHFGVPIAEVRPYIVMDSTGEIVAGG